jgi:hypothetical protein
MAKKGRGFGGWAFLLGVVLAVVLGLLNVMSPTWLWILVVIGIIVGLMNVSADETHAFLMSGAVLVIASAFGQNVMSSAPTLSNILDALLAIFVPALIVTAIKDVFMMAKN